MGKKLIPILFLLFSNKSNVAQDLIKIIDSMVVEDQKWRFILNEHDNQQFDSIPKATILQNLSLTDSLNYIQLKKIVTKYGFPNYQLVGEKTTHNFWLLIQHADKHLKFQKIVLKKMKKEVQNKNANSLDYAYLFDRVKVNFGKKQVFGTQMLLNSDSSSYIPKPLVNSSNLNNRRKKMGLPSIEEYTKIMNERYFGTLNQKLN